MVDIPKKDTINMLLPIYNIFGSSEGRMGPTIVFILTCVVPIGLWLFTPLRIIPFKIFIFLEVLWAIRMALYILGKEPEKMANWEVQKEDEYKSAEDLIRIPNIYDNGIFEYLDGTVALIICGLTNTYVNDNKFSHEYSQFLDKLDEFDVDFYLHMITEEFALQQMSERLRVYEDKEFMKERLEFYKDNDEYVDKNSIIWQHNFLVKTPKYNWKHMFDTITDIVNSSSSQVFHVLYIAGRSQVSDVMSRDLGTYINITDLLKKKYTSDNYNGSEVLFYGDNIPEEYTEVESGEEEFDRVIE